MLKRLGVAGPRRTIIELGTGTGQFALATAAVCERIIAVDVSAVMLDRLSAKIAAAAPPNLDIVQAGFLTYHHRSPPADAVYSRLALHHLPDFWKALALTRITAWMLQWLSCWALLDARAAARRPRPVVLRPHASPPRRVQVTTRVDPWRVQVTTRVDP